MRVNRLLSHATTKLPLQRQGVKRMRKIAAWWRETRAFWRWLNSSHAGTLRIHLDHCQD